VGVFVSDDIAIQVRGLGKKYTIGGPQEKYHTIRDAVANSVKAPFRKLSRQSADKSTNEFWALKDVSFDVHEGEVIGIIGRNGAGKSTLLKILSQITTPTEGEIDIYGRVGSLLEVGTGFHPELTGRENIFLSGSILGMRKREIEAKLDDIVKFSEIEKFLDTPVKRYSSGMYVRLAFSVAAHLETEILLVDEVLAVGDFAFQKKCIGKMSTVAREGKTIIFVSHNMAAVENLCKYGILLDNGQLISKGPVEEITNLYLTKISSQMLEDSQDLKNLEISIKSENENEIIRPGDTINFYVTLTSEVEIKDGGFGIGVTNPFGDRIVTFHTHYQYNQKWGFKKQCMFFVKWENNFLGPGDYILIAALYDSHQLIKSWDRIGILSVTASDYFKTGKLPDPNHQGYVLAKGSWLIKTDKDQSSL